MSVFVEYIALAECSIRIIAKLFVTKVIIGNLNGLDTCYKDIFLNHATAFV